MIYRVRTLKLIPDKKSTASNVACSAAEYVTEHFSGINVEILENISGSLHQIHMITRCESLAALEAYEANRQTDAGWLRLVEEFRALNAVVDQVDRLYRAVTPF
jgi:hypothetical protein